ncbi:ABC transporter substrate-binding protein [Leucobacter sp. CSA1]|uniref:ABC transporter substrate-binding protein n=1 Tax=Leucobacter chromiisoli TaxID=2796471 RepID=A0A934Q5L1_9MICO|nr:ABC transporter substrate-binding protein [Leucobacter chromiisoli]MBK0417805.1 ABC transporter substrate-binding protein [Leucobacter chromiisoli]
MPKLRRTVAAAAALAAAMVLSACSAGSSGNSGGSSAGADQDSLTVALTAEPQNFDFTTTGGAPIPQLLMTNVYEGLVVIDQEGTPQPQLAESWELSDDRKSYTFTLQEDVTFSNGEPFTADDVKASIERVQNDWVLDLKNKMDVVESVEVVSPTEVTVTLSRPSNAWLFDMGTSVGAMMPKEVGDLANEPIGTGPYVITDVKRGDSISLEARDDYWGEEPAIKDVTMRYFADAVATTNALRAGDVDLVYNLGAPDLIDGFKSDDAFSVVEGSTNREIMLAMNNKRAPFDDIRVRQAVRYAIDEQAVIDTAWAGYGTEIGGMVPPHDPYYEDLTDLYPYDPDKARDLLKEAGAENIDVTWKVPTLPYATAVSDIVVSQLADVGINVTIESTEFPAVWLDTVWTQADYEMTVIGTAEARDMLITFNDPEFYTGYDNSKIKDLAAAADQGTEEEYVEGMKEVARIISEDAAAEFLFLYPLVSVSKAGLEGVQENEVTEALTLSTMHWSE